MPQSLRTCRDEIRGPRARAGETALAGGGEVKILLRPRVEVRVRGVAHVAPIDIARPRPKLSNVTTHAEGGLIIDQPYSPSATLNWSTTGLPAGQYTVLVVARDATSSAAFDSFAWTDVTLT